MHGTKLKYQRITHDVHPILLESLIIYCIVDVTGQDHACDLPFMQCHPNVRHS